MYSNYCGSTTLQIREKLIGLIHHKIDMTEAWEERFDRLTLSAFYSCAYAYSYM